jgi:hypothetical protein
MRKQISLFVTFFSLCIGLSAWASPLNAAFGVSGSWRGDWGLLPASFEAVEGRALMKPILNLSGDWFEARGSFTGSIDAASKPVFSLDECFIKLFPSDFLILQAGRYAVNPGKASFFPLLSQLAPSDPLAFLYGDGGSLSDQAEVRLLVGNFHLDLAWRPAFLPVKYAKPDTAGIWFASSSFPETIKYSNITRTRSSIEIVDASSLSERSSGAGDFLLDLGASLGCLDLGIVGFSGISRDPIYIPSISLGPELMKGGSFVLELEPKFSMVKSLGAYISFAPEPGELGGVEAHIEALYTGGRLVEYGLDKIGIRYHEGVWSLAVADGVEAEEVAICAGGNWALPSLPVSFFAEARGLFHPWLDVPDASFSKLAVAGFRGSLFSERARWLFASAASFPSGGWCCIGQAAVALPGDSELSATLPLFFGPVGSDLGQFSAVRRLSLSFTTRM